MRSSARRMVALGVVAAFGAGAASSGADVVRIQSTSDTVDSNLVAGEGGSPTLQQRFQAYERSRGIAEDKLDTIDYKGVGTSAALNNARKGQADVAITHAPSVEAQFVKDGYSFEPSGRAIFYSDYVIVGPTADPAGVFTKAPHDAVSAFEAIAAAGAQGNAVFVSRNEGSGTNVEEQNIWARTDSAVTKAQPSGVTDTTRQVPFDSTTSNTFPAWYKPTGSTSQATNVLATANTTDCPKCYTITDRGTYDALVNAGTIKSLKVVSDKQTAAARGGENLLINPFSAYIVAPVSNGNHAAFDPGSPVPNVAAATRFVDFLTSEPFQTDINNFPSASTTRFFADAFPVVAGTPPMTATTGTAVPLNLTLTNRLPGGGSIAGIPVALQGSTDGGKTYANIGAPVNTDAAGKVSFAPTLAASTTYRVHTDRFKQFSPNDRVLGPVTAVAAAATATPAPEDHTIPPNGPLPALDITYPSVSKVSLKGRKLKFKVSSGGSVDVTIARKKGARYRTFKRLSFSTGRGAGKRKLKLKPGRYRITVALTTKSNDTATKSITKRIR